MLRVAKVCCFLCCAALLLMGRRICSAAEPEVVCPAIQQDDLYRYDETPEPISLILVGNVHQVKKDGERTGLLDVDVERVLYGFTKEGKLRVFERYRRPDGRQILALHTARTAQKLRSASVIACRQKKSGRNDRWPRRGSTPRFSRPRRCLSAVLGLGI